MYYVYVLQSKKDGLLYLGCTNNLKQRLLLHNTGRVYATKKRAPFKLIYYEAFINKHDAFCREQWLKTGWGRNQLKNILKSFFASLTPKEALKTKILGR
ncbi:MAG: GIY-YIG nuclease family protein [Patescibacteria group bacterium]|nr:GIY-YIG nuclease family protein [Patescibacteria group bacterium]MDD5121314.1 GIY-YIG nuclease family protein [Patescibacteria group bacterium]MDD5395767.1 GIY-YIG nuclease family protein [Patescibacteria group bacterium]